MRESTKFANEPLTSDGINRRFRMLTHDLRTAIGGITGNLSLIDKQALNPDDCERVLAAQASAQLLTHFLSDLTTSITGQSDENAPADLEIVDPRAFMEMLMRQWSGIAAAKGIEITTLCHDEVPETALLDSYRVSRIIGNVIQNSIKYSREGTIGIELASPDSKQLKISVCDSGPGFSQEARELMFSFSGRPGSSTQSGTGLGLHIAKKLTDQLSGTIDAFNRPDGGACVVLSLPLTQKSSASPMAIMPNAALPDLSGLKILLVEDNLTNQVVVSQMLEAMGADFSLASDGLEGLEALEANTFDMALIDIEMPRLSGLDLIRQVRARKDSKAKMSLVAFTAYAMREHRERINNAGADGLIAKPVTGIQELGNAILRHTPKSNSSSAPDLIDASEDTASQKPVRSIVDEQVFDGLLKSIGQDTMQELLIRVQTDLNEVHDKITKGLETSNWEPTRNASHVLVSVAGAIGATDLQHLAQRLNTHCHGNNFDLIVSASEECLSGIRDLQTFVSNNSL